MPFSQEPWKIIKINVSPETSTGGPVAKTSCSQCRGPGPRPLPTSWDRAAAGGWGGHACDSEHHPPSRSRAAPCARAMRRRGSTLTQSRPRRPEETAGHTVADQRVEALGLQALRGCRPVLAPQASPPSLHAARASSLLRAPPPPPAPSLGSAAPRGGNRAGRHPPRPSPPSCLLEWDHSAGGPAPQTLCGFSIQPSPLDSHGAGSILGAEIRLGLRPRGLILGHRGWAP